MSKVLLFNGASVTFANIDKYPSLSLMALSGVLKQRGYKPEIVTLSEKLGKLDGVCAVGMSVYTGTGISRSLALAKKVRKANPNVPIIWGGVHPTLEPDQCLRSKLVDYVIRGDGEYALVDLLDTLRNGGELREVAGVSWKSGGLHIHNEDRGAIPCDNFPRLDYSLYHDVLMEEENFPYLASRGCPHNCRFCCSMAFNQTTGKRFRAHSMERILADIAYIVETYDPPLIAFLDDNFLSNKKRLEAFMAEHKAKGYRFKWAARGRCDFFAKLDRETIKALRSSGLVRMDLGVESGSQRILDYLDKRVNVDDVLKAVTKINGQGIKTYCSFIFGFPGETLDDMEASVSLRNEIMRISPLNKCEFYTYTPLPKTDLEAECIKSGLYVPPKELEDYTDYNFHCFKAPWLERYHLMCVTTLSWASFICTFEPPFGLRGITKGLRIEAEYLFETMCFMGALQFECIDWLYRLRMRINRWKMKWGRG